MGPTGSLSLSTFIDKYFFVTVSLSDVEERLVWNIFDCRIEVDGVGVRSRFGELLNGKLYTLTKVVFPVPDIPITMMQQLLFYMLLIL